MADPSGLHLGTRLEPPLRLGTRSTPPLSTGCRVGTSGDEVLRQTRHLSYI